MAKISEVEIPHLQMDEQGTAPGTPGTGLVRVYAKDDGKLYIKDDAGTETDLTATGGGGGGGSAGLAFVESPTLTAGVFTYELAGGYDPDWLELHFVGVTVDTDGTGLILEVKSGGSWITANYMWNAEHHSTSGGVQAPEEPSAANVELTTSGTWGVGTGGGKAFSAVVRAWKPAGSQRKAGEWIGFYDVVSAQAARVEGGWLWAGGTGALEGLRVSGVSGDINGGEMLVYGATQS